MESPQEVEQTDGKSFEQIHPDSIRQSEVQPSPETSFISSHSYPIIFESPHIGEHSEGSLVHLYPVSI